MGSDLSMMMAGGHQALPPRRWQYGLTADEWFHIASEGENSEVPPCCGNIGAIRDAVRQMVPFQAPEDRGWRLTLGHEVTVLIAADGDGHALMAQDRFPLLHRVLDGIAAEQLLGIAACGPCEDGHHEQCEGRYCTCKGHQQ